MFGTTPFPRPYLAPFAPYFSLESRYRCAIKQRDEGSWTKTRHGIVLCWCEPVNGEPLLGRRPTSTRLHRLRKRKWMVDGTRWVRAWQNLTRRFCQRLTPSYSVPCGSMPLPYLLTQCTYLTYTYTHLHPELDICSLSWGPLAGRPGGKSPGW